CDAAAPARARRAGVGRGAERGRLRWVDLVRCAGGGRCRVERRPLPSRDGGTAGARLARAAPPAATHSWHPLKGWGGDDPSTPLARSESGALQRLDPRQRAAAWGEAPIIG